jgi:large repetitive protein
MSALARGPAVVALAVASLSGCMPPQITCPANITKSQDPGVCTAVTTFSPTFSDDSSASVVCDPPSGTAFPLGVTTDRTAGSAR